MKDRIIFTAIVFSVLVAGCTPTRQIIYDLKGIGPVSAPDTTLGITRNLKLTIEPFEDIRKTVPENGILFVRERDTKLYDKEYCINAEEHYKQDSVAMEVASVMAGHFARRQTFRSVACRNKDQADYFLTGKIRRLYGEQEFSTAARVGSAFGLIGALATAGAETNGRVFIEFTDLRVHRRRDGGERRLEDVSESFAGVMSADAYCWCIYDNVNDHLKASVEKLATQVENAIAHWESSNP